MKDDTVTPLVSIIIPAYNEAPVIGNVVERAGSTMRRTGLDAEILVVDDGSDDETAAIAKRCGARVITHPYNIGNGAAVKTGIRNARGEILVMLDGDGQHDPEGIPRLLGMLGPYDMVVGARTSDSETSAHRDLANMIYNWLASYVCGRRIEDLTSGFRAVKADVARGFVYLLPNTFSYPTTITMATLRSGRSLAYVPIKVSKRVGKSKIKVARDGVQFLMIVLRIATFFSPLRVFVPASLMMFLTGFGYGLFKVVVLGTRYGPTSAMLMTIAILVFLIGLVSEQVAQLRFEDSEMM